MPTTVAAEPQKPEPKIGLGEQIAQVVREMLTETGRSAVAGRVHADSSFERDLGLGSLDLVELVVRCESKLEIAVPDEVAEQADTPSGWAKAIQQGGQETAKSTYRIVAPSSDAPIVPLGAHTIIDALHHHAASAPDRIQLHVLSAGTGTGRTSGQLLDGAAILARGLAAQGIRQQDRVALLVQDGLDAFESFLAVQLAGAVPMLLPVPQRTSGIEDYAAEFSGVLRDAGAIALIASHEFWPAGRLLRALTPDLAGAYQPATLRAEGRRTWVSLPGPTKGAPAHLQLTAGMAGAPKSIPVAHETLLGNLRAFGDRLELRGDDGVACALPLSSDWGLRAWLFSAYYGAPLAYLSPQEFLEHPESWLWTIHRAKSTISIAPNSHFDACARRVPLWALEGLDLRHWRSAINSGEPVLAETARTFARRFSGFGFDSTILRPAYAVAEAGVLTMLEGRVSAKSSHESSEDATLSLGRPLPGTDIRVSEGQVEYRGEGNRAWVATGDTGYLRGGDLIVTGRIRDSIERGGQTAHAISVEAAAVRVPGVLAAAAFASSGRLIVAVESVAANSSSAGNVSRRVRQAIERTTGDQPDEVLLIAPGTLPRTGDGSLRRAKAAERFAKGSLGAVPNPRIAGMAAWGAHLPELARLSAASLQRHADTRLRNWQAASAAGDAALSAGRARKVLEALGEQAVIEGELTANTLVVGHRCAPLDAIAFAAFSRVPMRFAGDAVLVSTPEWLHASLRPLIVTTEEQMRHAVEQGVLILFPDNELGEPASRSRYRLPAFRVADTIVPATVEHMRRVTTIRLGRGIRAEGDAVARRELARTILERMRLERAGSTERNA